MQKRKEKQLRKQLERAKEAREVQTELEDAVQKVAEKAMKVQEIIRKNNGGIESRFEAQRNQTFTEMNNLMHLSQDFAWHLYWAYKEAKGGWND